MTIFLLGNPNSGKTTLFNQLTGMRHRVGNFPGVTVDLAEGFLLCDPSVRVIDMPGMYSLSAATAEEKIARDALFSHPPDAVIIALDATSLSRGLYLTLSLIEMGLPVVVALTMMDEAEKSRLSIDIEALSRALSVPVVVARAAGPAGLLAAAKKATPVHTTKADPASTDDPRITARYQAIDRITEACVMGNSETLAQKRSAKADRLLTHRLLALPLLALLMSAIFFITFGPPGQALQAAFLSLLEMLFGLLGTLLSRLSIAPWLNSLITEGIASGLLAVLSFLPIIAVLFLLLSLLEDSGYMARMAFCTDAPLRKIGLSGRSFAPLLIGFGCSVPAILATRTLPQRRDRILTILLVPFLSCSAKVPIYALMLAAFFTLHSVFYVILLYVYGLMLGIAAIFALGRLSPADHPAPFLLELPPYRVPSLKTCLSRVWLHAKGFLVHALTLLLLSATLTWALSRVSLELLPAAPGDSLLAALGRLLSPMFLPLGFSDWRLVAALLSGLMAKEGVITALGVLMGHAEGALPAQLSLLLSPASAAAFLVFVLLYMPCISAFAATKKELGARYALLFAFFHTGIAWLIACIVYNTASFFS